MEGLVKGFSIKVKQLKPDQVRSYFFGVKFNEMFLKNLLSECEIDCA